MNDDISAVIESIIARESSPISAKEIFQRVKVLNDTVDLWQIETQLKQLQEQGLLYEYPPLRKTQKCRYWHKPPVQWVKDRIKNFVGQDSPWPTIKYVRTKLHKWERNFFNAAYGDLIEGKSLFELRLYNSAYLLPRSPLPSEHLLTRQKSALQEILERINRYRHPPITIQGLVAFIDGAPSIRETKKVGQVSDELLLQWYEEDQKQMLGSRSVPIPMTWNRYQLWCKENDSKPDLEYFHGRLKQLSAQGRIELVPHSGTITIPENEQPLAIRTEKGELLYFWRHISGG